MGSLTQPKLPVIDFSNEKLQSGTSSWLSTAKAVRLALEEYGCFLAIYDEATPEMHNNLFHQAMKELFDLPRETKEKNAGDLFGFGYSGNFSTLLMEYLGIQDAGTPEATQSFTNLMWPDGNDFFCETAYSYSKLLSDLYQVVMRMAFEDYGVAGKSSSDSFIQSALFLMRFIKYQTPQMKKTNTGLLAHTDKDFLAILESNQVQGLEIETRQGEWVGYEPAPSTFLVIAGEPFTAWSNGRVCAPQHRVVINGDEERYTVGLFSFMRDAVETPEELVDEDHPLQFKPFNHFAFLQYCGGEGIKDVECPIKAYCGV